MVIHSFLILLPLIFLALGGYVLSDIYSLSEETLIRIVTDFFMPALIFYSLYTSDINLAKTLKLFGAVSFVLAFLFVLSLFYCRFFKLEFKAFAPPVLFMNSGFLGIPLMKLWGGFAAMNYIVIYDQIQTFYIFTLGIIIVTGGFTLSGVREMIKSPLLWAIIAGFLCKHLRIPVWENLIQALGYCGAGAPALATFALGCSLKNRRIIADPHLLSGLIFRFVFGFLAGWIATAALNISGMERTVILVASSLPSAVFSVVLPLRYGINARFAGSLVLASSLLSILIIPIVFYFCSP
ncbi:MAG: AEC family transporter [Proteobacteria bacterium]|nr:AEC family transporter [Pseudomonadota bacterium]MBU1582474.1 AEC family transporter [Pseudomonadota bacterium]MBU2454895.1 AEC family transporter [Pseudomonadota bacterium]MBU2627597.1 AEC family transporter [Pseudomonadota bacterium]